MDTDNHIDRGWLARTFVVVAAGLVGTFAAVLASPVVMPRIIRRHPDWLRLWVFKRYAGFRRRHAGHQRSVTALLAHVGRQYLATASAARRTQEVIASWERSSGPSPRSR